MKRGVLFLFAFFLSACGASKQPNTEPAGSPVSAKTEVLKTGAKVLQGNSPVDAMNVYLVGFHPMKEDPQHQMEAHHFCHQVNEDFAQCALFDSNTKNANLNGIEYIISEKVFDTLPAGEKQYWHPHNYEILSGELVAPGLPEVAEKELMRTKMNSYGKTWHIWMTDQGQKLPLGAPVLAWSFNRDGEVRPDLISRRDQTFGISTQETRNRRQDLQSLAKPQLGVDTIKDKFGKNTRAIPGVVEKTAMDSQK